MPENCNFEFRMVNSLNFIKYERVALFFREKTYQKDFCSMVYPIRSRMWNCWIRREFFQSGANKK